MSRVRSAPRIPSQSFLILEQGFDLLIPLRANETIDETANGPQDKIGKLQTCVEEKEERDNLSQKAQPVEDASLQPTAKNLKQHNRYTKSQRSQPDSGTALREWDYTKMGRLKKSDNGSKGTPSSSDPSDKTDGTARSVSTTDPKFPRLVRQNGVLDKVESAKSSNFATAKACFGRARESPSPTVEQFEKFQQKVMVSENEREIELAMLPMLKEYEDANYNSVWNQQFNEFPRNIGFNDGLSAPKPDFVEGYLEKSFGPYRVKDRLGGSAVPTGARYPAALAHLAGEFKKSGGDLVLASQQAAYDAACLVFGRNNAATSIGEADAANTAHVGSFYTDGNQLAISIHYSAKDSSGETVYHQNRVYSGVIGDDHESFRTGWRHLRNAQDWSRENARKLRDGLIAQASQPPKGAEEDEDGSTPAFVEIVQQQLS